MIVRADEHNPQGPTDEGLARGACSAVAERGAPGRSSSRSRSPRWVPEGATGNPRRRGPGCWSPGGERSRTGPARSTDGILREMEGRPWRAIRVRARAQIAGASIADDPPTSGSSRPRARRLLARKNVAQGLRRTSGRQGGVRADPVHTGCWPAVRHGARTPNELQAVLRRDGRAAGWAYDEQYRDRSRAPPLEAFLEADGATWRGNGRRRPCVHRQSPHDLLPAGGACADPLRHDVPARATAREKLSLGLRKAMRVLGISSAGGPGPPRPAPRRGGRVPRSSRSRCLPRTPPPNARSGAGAVLSRCELRTQRLGSARAPTLDANAVSLRRTRRRMCRRTTLRRSSLGSGRRPRRRPCREGSRP